MRARPLFLSLFVSLILVTQILLSSSLSAAPLVAGSYEITENTDLGAQVRITVQLSLINPTATPLTVTKVAIPSISAAGQIVTVVHSFVVQAHSNSQVSLQFLIAKKDFNVWHSTPHQQFLITLTPSGGKSTLVNLPLLRTQG